MNLSEAIDKFIYFKKSIGCSSATIVYYKRNLNLFYLFLGEINLDLINSETFLAFQDWLLKTYCIKKVSIQTYARATKVFLRWLREQKLIKINLKSLKLLKIEKTIVYPLTNNELITLINFFSENNELELRNKLICILMFDCGLRRGEIPKLKVSSINYMNKTLEIEGKGNKKRIVTYGKNFETLLKKYFIMTEQQGREYMFLKNDGCPITENTIKMVFERLKKQVGIPRLYPHLLRHTYATNYLLDGGDIETLRILMGHDDISTTQKYVHIAAQMRIINNFSKSYLDKMLEDNLNFSIA